MNCISADTVIIGGGLHGGSVAVHLASRGVSCIVLEKDHVGRHASGVNAGGVRILGRALPEIPIAKASRELWHNIRDLVDDDCGFVPSGQVKVAETEDELA
ncbi:MAG: FAD-dependent oxidoreductase, partial [Arenicellales bacterium]|nr:FAD-dependent oxidoreductase [Arenicellales bacterium]